MQTTNTLTATSLSLPRLLAERYKLVLLLLGVITTGFFLWLTRHFGAGTTPDSAAYLSVADHLLTGRGLITFDGSPLTLWPPLYPALLAGFSYLFGSQPYAVVSVLNSFIYGFIVYLSGILFFRHLKSPWLALIGTVSVMVSEALLWVTIMALTDVLFSCLVLIYLVCSESYQTKSRAIWFVLAAIAVGLAALTRYAAMIMLAIGVASILLFYKESIRSKLVHILLFGLIAGVPYALWEVRTYSIAGSLFGPGGPPAFSFLQVLDNVLHTILTWYAPDPLASSPLALFLLGIGLGLVLGLIRKHWVSIGSVWMQDGIIFFFVIGYVVFLIIIGTITSRGTPIDNRLLAPVFAPITVLLLSLIEKIADVISLRVAPRIVGVALGIVLSASLFYSAQVSYSNARRYLDQGGWGFNNVYWRNHNTILYVMQHPDVVRDCTVYSNEPDALYIVAGIESKGMSDRAFLKRIQDQAAQGKFPKEDKMCIVWIEGVDRSYLINADDLKAVTNQELRGQFKDGSITAVSKKVN